MPRLGLSVAVASQACPVVDGWLDPNRQRMFEACFYTAADKPYSLPARTPPTLWCWPATPIGKAMPRSTSFGSGLQPALGVKQGDELWVRTQSSGADCLVYRATGLHSPARSDLADDASIWGDGAVPGRLVTIGCRQPSDLSRHASRNVVVVWEFNRVGRPA